MANLKDTLNKEKAFGRKAELIAADIRKLEKQGKPVPQAKKDQLFRAHKQLMKSITDCFKLMDKKGPSHFSRENTWIWGGPTPYWGGSDKPDCAVDGAEYFGLENIVYMYGPTDENAIKLSVSQKWKKYALPAKILYMAPRFSQRCRENEPCDDAYENAIAALEAGCFYAKEERR